MKGFFAGFAGAVLVLALAAGATWLYLQYVAAGFSARATPTRLEASLAAHARAAAVPERLRLLPNPVPKTDAAMHEAAAHYADHCAVCHAANGSGDTMMGNGMYPRPPDLRAAATQHKTDGELFSIIENGIRLSGMPAFGGDPAAEPDSWKLVHLIRHMPRMAPDEVADIAAMSPRTPADMQEEQKEADFLSGTDAAPAVSKKKHLSREPQQ